MHFNQVQCLRLISALNILDCFALIHSPKSSKRYLLRATNFYEKFTKKKKESTWGFDFIKPFYKELFCYRNLLTKPVNLRKFWYHLLLTSDYYPKKIQLQGTEWQFKMYLGLFVYKFYSQIGDEWDLLKKFFAGFLADCFFKFGRLNSGLFFHAQKIKELQFQSISKREIDYHFEELQSRFLKPLFPKEHSFLLGNLYSIVN